MKTLMKYRHYLPLHIRFGRSSLARSDTAGSSITKTHIPRVIVFRPPRIDLACRIGKSKSRLVDTSQWRTPLVHGRAILARSDAASGAIYHAPLYDAIVCPIRSSIFKPPRADVAGRNGKWEYRLVDTSQWRTPLVHGRSILSRSDTANIAITTPPKNDSTCRPPLRKWVKLNDIWRNIFAERAQWRTPFVQCIDTRENATSVQGWRGMPV